MTMRLMCLGVALGAAGCTHVPAATPLRGDHHELAVLMCGEAHPPCLWPVRTPSGVAVTRAFPFRDDVDAEQHDHPHHRSVWFAHGDVNGHDAWHGDLHIRTVRVGREDGAIVSLHEWVTANGEVILRDSRRWRSCVHDDAIIIDIDITLDALDEPVVFGDTKEGTMAIRLHPELRVDGPVANGTLVTSVGIEGKPVWGTRARWCAAQGSVDANPVTVALVDHPANVNHPTWWHARTYGLLSANPFGRRSFEGRDAQPMQVIVEPGESLRLRYRLIAADGIVTPDAMDALATGVDCP